MTKSNLQLNAQITVPGQVEVGWWVGWVTRGDDTYVFAINLDLPTPEVLPKRQEIARAVLKQVGALP